MDSLSRALGQHPLGEQPALLSSRCLALPIFPPAWILMGLPKGWSMGAKLSLPTWGC
jgi:hypothetical protein